MTELPPPVFGVTTDAVVWIEMIDAIMVAEELKVTTDAVVWIEIPGNRLGFHGISVTTDAVVWIEIVVSIVFALS